MRDWSNAFKYLVYVGQLGLDLIMPVLLCLAGCWYLDTHFGFGMWIYFVGLFFGLDAGFMTFWKFYTKIVMKGQKRPDKNKPKSHSFSKHY